MKHNLPQPSQAWGTDVDRRIASLEAEIRLLKSNFSNSVDTINALTNSRSTSGVAVPFSDSMIIPQPGRSHGVGTYEDLWYQSLPWGDSGSFMQLTLSGTLELVVGADLFRGDSRGPAVSVGVMDGSNGHVLRSYCYTSYRSIGQEGKFILDAIINYTTIIPFDKYYDGFMFLGVEGSASKPQLIYNWDGYSHLSMQITGVRY